jgi:hypothetical protein
MSVPISSSCENVEEILTGPYKFAVPYFQRGYAWQQEHVERLITDLVAHSGGSQSMDWYPLGAIIIAHRPGAAVAEVADGHQRLITLTILIAVLRDLETEDARRRRLARCIHDEGGAARFSTLQGTAELLLAAVQADGATVQGKSTDGLDLTPSEAAVLDNRTLIVERLGELSPAERRRLADFLLERTILVKITVGEESAARLLFSTMHETGLKPQTADLLKSRVLGRCTGEIREQAQTIWEWLEARLGRDRMDGLFLNVAAIKSRALATEHPEVALGQAFDFESPEAASRFVLEHLRPIGTRHVEMLNAGLDPSAKPGPVFRRLQYLSWVIRHDTWRLPALHWLVQAGYEHPQTLAFLKRLEALAWVQMIRAEEAVRRDRRYLAVLGDIDSGRALEPERSLGVARHERETVRSILVGANLARRPYKLFLLLRLNSIYEGDGAVTVTPEATMEHIFPQRPGAASGWARDYGQGPDDAGLKHMLGNLTLLTEREQNRAANRDFEFKRAIYAESAFALSRRLASSAAWRPEDIRARTDELAEDFLADLGLA